MSQPVLDADRVVTRLRSAFNHAVPRQEMLTLAAELIQGAGAPYTSVYLYMLHGNELVLDGIAGFLPCEMRTGAAELRALLRLALKPRILWWVLRGKG